MLFAGLCAGYAAWLTLRDGIPWDFSGDFLRTLLTTGVFCSVFTGVASAVPAITREFNFRKAFVWFAPAAALGLALPMTFVVVFSFAMEIGRGWGAISPIVGRALWWLVLAFSLAVAFSSFRGNLKIFFKVFLALGPSVFFVGQLNDRFFIPRGMWLQGSLVLGVSVGAGVWIIFELLKESWLEEYKSGTLVPQYILDTEEFLVGSDENCDLTTSEGPSQIFCIMEKDGFHSLEVVDSEPVYISGTRFKYRVLVEGDLIRVEKRVFIFRTRFSRSRDVVPSAVCN